LNLLEAFDSFQSASTPDHGDDSLYDGHDDLMLEFCRDLGTLTDRGLLDYCQGRVRRNETHLDGPGASCQSRSTNTA